MSSEYGGNENIKTMIPTKNNLKDQDIVIVSLFNLSCIRKTCRRQSVQKVKTSKLLRLQLP